MKYLFLGIILTLIFVYPTETKKIVGNAVDKFHYGVTTVIEKTKEKQN